MKFARAHALLGLSVGVLMSVSAASATAQSARRRNWMPSGNTSPVLMGDLWSFKCPAGGFFAIFVDTMNDNSDGTSNLDPMLEVVDAKGNFLDFGDDNVGCTFAPTCGFACPSVGFNSCGTGTHTVAIANVPGSCNGGGGYKLELTVIDKKGNVLTDTKTGLGGGAKIKAPKWATGLGKTEPVIDDSVVPSLILPIPDPTLTALDTEEPDSAVDETEAEATPQDVTEARERKREESVRALAAKQAEAEPSPR